VISASNSQHKILVMPTNEELSITLQSAKLTGVAPTNTGGGGALSGPGVNSYADISKLKEQVTSELFDTDSTVIQPLGK
jgi:hypothetical protein